MKNVTIILFVILRESYFKVEEEKENVRTYNRCGNICGSVGLFVLLEQVFVNLLDNAVKYSKPNSKIYLNVKPTSKWIEVSISNKGPKLSDEDLERIFDKFYRVPSSSDVTGTGLGLTIYKEIVEAHKGGIWAYNHAEGLTIAFTIPLPEVEIGEIPPTKRGDAGE